MEEESEKIYPPPATFKAKIWKHYGFMRKPGSRELDMTQTVCKVCKKKSHFLNNTTNLRYHMTKHHPDIYDKEPQAGTSSTTTPGPRVSDPKTQLTLGESFNNKFPARSQKAQKITQAVLGFICKDLRPLSVVENAGFRQLLNECEPRYQIPTRKWITETGVPDLYADVKKKVTDTITSANRVGITTDAWTSRATESYVTVTCHHISPEWEMVSHVLQTRAFFESHTGKNVADLLREVMAEWGLVDKDPALVTDNASNMLVAAEISKLTHVKCFAHSLNLAAQRALKLPAVSRLLGRVRTIVAYFRRSPKALAVLKAKQVCLNIVDHKLTTDVATRWNSACDMLERFLEQQPAICAALLDKEVRKNAKDLWTLNDADITAAEDVVKALKPLKVATHVMSEEKTPTLSVIAPMQAQLCHSAHVLPTDPPIVRDIKHAISTDLGKRYGDEEKPFLCMASALDPRFKALPFLEEEGREETFTSVAGEAARISAVRKKTVLCSLIAFLLSICIVCCNLQQ